MTNFADRFAAWWSDPDPDTLDGILAPDVRLVQPLSRETRTLADGIENFRGILTLIPDLRATVHDSSQSGNVVFIRFTLHGTFGGRPISWEAVDRFELRDDGLATERISWFDSAPLLGQMLLRPRGWPAILRWSRAAFIR